MKNVLGLEREPFPARFRGSENHIKTHLHKHIFYKHLFSRKKLKKLRKWSPKGVPKRDFILGVGALGRSWGTFGARVSLLTQKMEPKCSKNDAKEAKMTPKEVPKQEKIANNGPAFCKKDLNKK